MEGLSRTARVIQFFAQRAPGGRLGVTHVLKLAYLSDLAARGHTGAPVTGLRYVWHHHGPFDSYIYGAIRQLEAAGLVEERRRSLWPDRTKREIHPRATVGDLGFTPAEAAVLEFIAERYAALTLKELLGEVYETEPMRIVRTQGRRGAPLPMESMNNRFRDATQPDFAAILAEEEEVKRGNYVLADDFFHALRAEAVTWDAGVD